MPAERQRYPKRRTKEGRVPCPLGHEVTYWKQYLNWPSVAHYTCSSKRKPRGVDLYCTRCNCYYSPAAHKKTREWWAWYTAKVQALKA